MKTITTIQYIADDGAIFNNKEQCESYEAKQRSEAANDFWNLDSESKDADELGFTTRYAADDVFRIIPINSRNDVRVINDYLTYHNPGEKRLAMDDIGTIQIFWCWGDCPGSHVYLIGTAEQWKESICKEIDELVNA